MSKNTLSIESDFVQEKNLQVLSEKIISKGHFTFKKENRLRWEYTSPSKYLIVINNQKIIYLINAQIIPIAHDLNHGSLELNYW